MRKMNEVTRVNRELQILQLARQITNRIINISGTDIRLGNKNIRLRGFYAYNN